MKFFVVALSLFAVAAAAPTVSESALEERRQLPALEHEEIHDEFGQFALRYVTAEGTVVSERGRLVPNMEGDGYVMVFEGEVTYIGEDGQTYVTKYSAGLDGNHVEGNHLPVPVEPLDIAEEPVKVVEEPMDFVREPVEVVVEPVEEIEEPIRIVYERAY